MSDSAAEWPKWADECETLRFHANTDRPFASALRSPLRDIVADCLIKNGNRQGRVGPMHSNTPALSPFPLYAHNLDTTLSLPAHSLPGCCAEFTDHSTAVFRDSAIAFPERYG